MPSKTKLLVIDDEERILKLIRDLAADDYEVHTAPNGEDGLALAQEISPDVILIDHIMPKMDGVLTTKFLRRCASTREIPILMLTALKEPEDRLSAFQAGVDDFISKPFHPDELLARIEGKVSRFRELRRKGGGTFSLGNLHLGLQERLATVAGSEIHLTATEFNLLRALLEDTGRVRTRSELMAILGGDSSNDRILDSHMASLRRKLKKFDGEIATVYGHGYVARGRK